MVGRLRHLLLPGCFIAMAGWVTAEEAIKVTELEQPPVWIGKLLDRGSVTFSAGPRSSQPESTLSAETRFTLNLQYRTRNRWSIQTRSGRRVLRIVATYSKVNIVPVHKVWFRKPPPTKDFWSDRLVLHELDHVMISSDDRLEKRLAELLRDNRVIEHSLEFGAVVSDAQVEKLVDQHTRRFFDQIVELAQVRYRELDRLTKHGRLPIPKDSGINEFLDAKPKEQVEDQVEKEEI